MATIDDCKEKLKIKHRFIFFEVSVTVVFLLENLISLFFICHEILINRVIHINAEDFITVLLVLVKPGYQLLRKKLKSYSNYHISSEYAHDIMTLTNNKYVFPVKNWSLSKLFET